MTPLLQFSEWNNGHINLRAPSPEESILIQTDSEPSESALHGTLIIPILIERRGRVAC